MHSKPRTSIAMQHLWRSSCMTLSVWYDLQLKQDVTWWIRLHFHLFNPEAGPTCCVLCAVSQYSLTTQNNTTTLISGSSWRGTFQMSRYKYWIILCVSAYILFANNKRHSLRLQKLDGAHIREPYFDPVLGDLPRQHLHVCDAISEFIRCTSPSTSRICSLVGSHAHWYISIHSFIHSFVFTPVTLLFSTSLAISALVLNHFQPYS